ncbi:MAG: YtpR family tRNA-binding protein [Akkermansia muciniphila]
MKISLNWLSQYIDLSGLSVDEMSDMLTFAGIEVEDIRQQGVDSPYVVVARVAAAEQHPQADRLKVCQVDVGDGTLHQIVCGAQNYKVGDKVPCALPGAVLPGNVEIKVGKLRGVESRGMLCSASELGLPDKEHGLWILPELEPGAYFPGCQADTLVEVEVAPKPDLLSHNGMAYELAAISGREYRPVSIDDAGWNWNPPELRAAGPAGMNVLHRCKISGVNVQESPEWLKEPGSRRSAPINNIVDITSFVLHELERPPCL